MKDDKDWAKEAAFVAWVILGFVVIASDAHALVVLCILLLVSLGMARAWPF